MKYKVNIEISNIPEDDYDELMSEIDCFIGSLGLSVDIGIGEEDE